LVKLSFALYIVAELFFLSMNACVHFDGARSNDADEQRGGNSATRL